MSDKKVVNFYIHTLGGGGAEKALVNLVNNMDKDRYSITLTTILNTGSLIEQVSEEVKLRTVIKIPKFILSKFTNSKGTIEKSDKSGSGSLKKIYYFFWKYLYWVLIPITSMKNFKSDFIVSFLEGPTQILVGSIRSKAKKIAWVHVDIGIEKKSELFFRNVQQNRDLYRKFDKVICVSKEIKNSLIKYLKISNDVMLEVCHNVYDVSSILENSKRFSLDFDKSIINVVTVGRLSDQKGYDRLINAISQINEKKRLKVYILGDGENRDKLQNQIEDLSLSNTVNLVGFVDNPYPYIKHADVFISSSRTEGYSTVLVEALVLGTPIISTKCSGVSDILGDGRFGQIVENNTESIRKSLVNLLGDGSVISELREKSQLGMSNYSLEESVKNIEMISFENIK